MKKTFTLTVFLILFAAITPGFGQRLGDLSNPVTVLGKDDIFKQGAWNFNLEQVINFQAGSTFVDNEKTGSFRRNLGKLEANYFVIDHLAVGAGLGFSGNRNNQDGISMDLLNRTEVIKGNLNVLYGDRIGGVINVLTKASIGGGRQKQTYDYGYGEQTSNSPFLNLDLTIGTPIGINKNVYFQPYAGYSFQRTRGDQFREISNTFQLGFTMEYFMGCGDNICDLSENPLSIDERFRKGDIELGSRMYGKISGGGQKTISEGMQEFTSKDGISSGNLSGYGLYYLADNLGLGAGLDVLFFRNKSKDNDFLDRSREFIINPILRYHVPATGMLKNLYGETSFGIGKSSTFSENGEIPLENKEQLTRWKVGLGYNYYIAEHFSISPMLGFFNENRKNKDQDQSNSSRGLYAGIGWNYHLTKSE